MISIAGWPRGTKLRVCGLGLRRRSGCASFCARQPGASRAALRWTCLCRRTAGASCARPRSTRAERDSDAASRRARRVSPHTPPLRRLQNATIPYLVRLNLFALGFQYISITGEVAPRKEAPIVVCNHQARAQRAAALLAAADVASMPYDAGLSGHLALPLALPAGGCVRGGEHAIPCHGRRARPRAPACA